MRILGIDPGPTESAWVVFWDGAVAEFGKDPNEHMTPAFFAARAGRDVGMATTVAIEMIQSFGMAVGAEVFETCVWVGRFAERAHSAGASVVRRIYRGKVKMHLCHSMRAKDPNIRQALIDKLGAPGTKKAPGPTYGIAGDCWAALAVAVTASETPAD